MRSLEPRRGSSQVRTPISFEYQHIQFFRPSVPLLTDRKIKSRSLKVSGAERVASGIIFSRWEIL